MHMLICRVCGLSYSECKYPVSHNHATIESLKITPRTAILRLKKDKSVSTSVASGKMLARGESPLDALKLMIWRRCSAMYAEWVSRASRGHWERSAVVQVRTATLYPAKGHSDAGKKGTKRVKLFDDTILTLETSRPIVPIGRHETPGRALSAALYRSPRYNEIGLDTPIMEWGADGPSDAGHMDESEILESATLVEAGEPTRDTSKAYILAKYREMARIAHYKSVAKPDGTYYTDREIARLLKIKTRQVRALWDKARELMRANSKSAEMELSTATSETYKEIVSIGNTSRGVPETLIPAFEQTNRLSDLRVG